MHERFEQSRVRVFQRQCFADTGSGGDRLGRIPPPKKSNFVKVSKNKKMMKNVQKSHSAEPGLYLATAKTVFGRGIVRSLQIIDSGIQN
jgi:hypothetical protein